MEQVIQNIDVNELLKQAAALRQYDLYAKVFMTGNDIYLHVGQQYQNAPEKVILEVTSGFDVVARQEVTSHNNEVMSILKFKKGVLSPVTRLIAVKATYEGDGAHDRLYFQRVGDSWQRVFWKTFVEDIIHLEKTYKRKYTHW